MQKGESKPGSVPHLLPVIFQPMVFTLRKASASWPDSPEFWATSQHTYIDMQTHREGNNYFFVLHRLGLTFKEALRRKVKIHTICPQNHTVPSIFLVINLDRTYRKLEEKNQQLLSLLIWSPLCQGSLTILTVVTKTGSSFTNKGTAYGSYEPQKKQERRLILNVNPQGSSGFIKLFPLSDCKASWPLGEMSTSM